MHAAASRCTDRSASPAGIPAVGNLRKGSDAFKEDGNRQQHMCIAELSASKDTVLPGAAIDARCAGITLRDAGLATGTTEGRPTMRFALNRRNPSITEVFGESSRMAFNSDLRLYLNGR